MRPSSVVLALILLLIGCAAPGSTNTSTPTTATETVEPSATASASPDEGPDEATRPIFQNEALATVRVNGLDVRADPGLAAPVLDDDYGAFNANGKVRLRRSGGTRSFLIGFGRRRSARSSRASTSTERRSSPFTRRRTRTRGCSGS